MHVVTVSAAYGAGGSIVGPAVAERLCVPFIDRAIPTTVAVEIGCSLEEALAHDERAEHGLGRLLAGAARLPNAALGGMDVYVPPQSLVSEEEFVAHTESVIRGVSREGGVVLGRAAAVVLADHPGALHVRLDGPKDDRIAQAMRLHGRDEETVRREQEDTDRARTSYVKHFYRVDPTSPGLYHLVLNSTSLSFDACVDIIVTAARIQS